MAESDHILLTSLVVEEPKILPKECETAFASMASWRSDVGLIHHYILAMLFRCLDCPEMLLSTAFDNACLLECSVQM